MDFLNLPDGTLNDNSESELVFYNIAKKYSETNSDCYFKYNCSLKRLGIKNESWSLYSDLIGFKKFVHTIVQSDKTVNDIVSKLINAEEVMLWDLSIDCIKVYSDNRANFCELNGPQHYYQKDTNQFARQLLRDYAKIQAMKKAGYNLTIINCSNKYTAGIEIQNFIIK